MAIKRRAINDQQKQMRRQAMLDQAWRLFQQGAYEQIQIATVAAGLGLAKGTIYVYFPTKEALYLAVLEQQFSELFAALAAAFAAGGPVSIEQMTQRFTTLLVERPHLRRLFAIAHSILEENIDAATARAHKHWLLGQLLQTGAHLEAAAPFLRAGQGVELLLRAYALVIGIQQLAEPAALVREVIAHDADLALFQADFAREFALLFSALLHHYARTNA